MAPEECPSGSPVACPQRDDLPLAYLRCHHIPKGVSLLPACPPTVTTVTCPQTDTRLVHSQRDFPTASISPKGCPQCQPYIMSPKLCVCHHRSPHCWCDHKGMFLMPPCPQRYAPTALECPQRGAPTDVSPLPLLRHVPKWMSPQPAQLCVPRGLHPLPPIQYEVSRGVSPLLVSPHMATPAAVSPQLQTPKTPGAGQTTIRGQGRRGGRAGCK